MPPLRLAVLWGLLALSCSLARADFSQCPQFFPGGAAPAMPQSAPGLQRQLCFDAFAVLHSGRTKTPLYTVERLNRAQLLDARDEQRTDRFYEEARLPSAHRARLEDYRAGLSADGTVLRFDRGHMAPAANMPTAQAMAQSFSLANMVPQAPQNNRRTWARIESDTRKYVMRARGDVYVFTGPVFAVQPPLLGPGRVAVPRSLFKLVYDERANRAWAHWVDNTDDARASAPLSYEELRQRTGIEFLPGRKPER